MDSLSKGRIAATGLNTAALGGVGTLVGSLLDFTITGGIGGAVVGLTSSLVFGSRGLARRRTIGALNEVLPEDVRKGLQVPAAQEVPETFLNGFTAAQKDIWAGVKACSLVLKVEAADFLKAREAISQGLAEARSRLMEVGATMDVAKAYFAPVILVTDGEMLLVS